MDARRDQVYWQENPIPHPAHVPFQPVHLGVAPEVVSRLVGVLDDFPRVQVYSTNVNDRSVRRATKNEDFHNTLFPALMDDRDEDTWDLVLEDIVRFGRGYDQLLFVPKHRSSKAPDYPERGKDEEDKAYGKRQKEWQMRSKLPLVWRHLPARNVFVWRDDYGPDETLIVTKRRVKELLAQYKLPNLAADAGDGHGYAVFAEYWSRDWGAYWAGAAYNYQHEAGDRHGVEALRDVGDGELATTFPNMYGYVPIVETSGLISTDSRRGRRQMSVLDHMLGICEYLDQLVSQKASAVRVWAWPTPYLKNLSVGNMNLGNLPLGEDGRPIPIELEAGKMLTLLPGEDIGWLVVPDSGAGADDLIGLIQRQADSLGISSAMFSGTALNSNGYLYNSVMNAVRSKYSPILKHVRRSHVQRVQHTMRIVEMVGEPLYLFKPGDGQSRVGEWIGLGPDDVRGAFYTMDVQYEDHLPTDDAADMGLAVQATSGEHPLVDRNTARERWLRITDPERMEERIRLQKFLDRPEVEEIMVQRIVSKAQLFIDEEERGTPEDALAGLSPEEIAMLPPQLLANLGVDTSQFGTEPPPGNGQMLPGDMTGGPYGVVPPGPSGPQLAAPSTMGGIPGAASTPRIPGVTTSLTPAPPSRAPKLPEPSRPPGRARGQSRKPPRQQQANASS